eukprot:TRINITY_DN17865_c0_g1_i1.p1 TRINITY_DN17865_c0_g1~~TRINITY_DN17865_c0_g1_i1.p1  ORF type:complete len:591 (-),score=144.72 TRINITY_DN17865_c0_g1_i1:335-2107(-)
MDRQTSTKSFATSAKSFKSLKSLMSTGSFDAKTEQSMDGTDRGFGRSRTGLSVTWANFGMDKPVTNLDNLNDFDPEAEVNSPRSLRACESEGILPEELIYKPEDAFRGPGTSPEVVSMRYEFAEARRQDLLQVARVTRTMNIEKEAAGVPLSDNRVLFGVGISEPYYKPGNSVKFFKDRLFEYCPNAVAPSAEKAEELKKAAKEKASAASYSGSGGGSHSLDDEGAAGGLTMGSGASPGNSAKGSPREGEGGGSSPKFNKLGGHKPRPGWKPNRPLYRLCKSSTSASAPLMDTLLTQLVEAPRTTRIEQEGAVFMANHLMTKRERDLKDRRKANKDAMKLANKCQGMATQNYQDMLDDREEDIYKREFREMMALPPSMSDSGRPPSFVKAAMVREKVNRQVQQRESRWKDYCEGNKLETQRRKERLTEDFYLKKFSICQGTMEERIRWRFQNDEVCAKREEYEADKLRLFQKRAEDALMRQMKASNNATMRKELGYLRDVNRMMVDAQRARKEAYKEKLKKQVVAEKRMARTIGGPFSMTSMSDAGEDDDHSFSREVSDAGSFRASQTNMGATMMGTRGSMGQSQSVPAF